MLTAERRVKNVINIRDNGVVYTPKILADYVAQKLVDIWYQDIPPNKSGEIISRSLEKLKIVDPACGEGELLLAVLSKLNKLDTTKKINFAQKLYGIDLDKGAIITAKTKIYAVSDEKFSIEDNFLSSNTLILSDKLMNRTLGKFDLLIANPPWGANTFSYSDKLQDKNYRLAKGQYDTSDLFIEKSFSMLNDGGYGAFIIPDSIFAHEREQLRSLLLAQSEIKFIARLGEKLFKNINRACTVIIFKKTSTSNKKNSVMCMRLTPHYRYLILSGSASFQNAESALKHEVPQIRFSTHPEHMFDIDTKEIDVELINKISRGSNRFSKYITSSRGVEISKKGLVYKCYFCSKWSPVPSSKLPKCNHCYRLIKIDNCETSTIITKNKMRGSQPLIVGESIQRYSLLNNYWIDTAVEGINYKQLSMYYEPKILIRKTGVGITATVDYSNSMTNQVVYMFRLQEKYKKTIPLETILAIMNSRVMYYYLVKSFGEIEWRSYPYLTQSQVLNLPIPDLATRKARMISKEIFEKLNPYLSKNKNISNSIDAKIENKVAELFGLDGQDYSAIYKSLAESQDLKPVRALTKIKLRDIFPS